MATVYRLLSDEGKAVAREKARARYQRTRDARKRQAYLRVLQQIKSRRDPPWSPTDSMKPLRVGWISTAGWYSNKASLLPNLLPPGPLGVVKGLGLGGDAIRRDG